MAIAQMILNLFFFLLFAYVYQKYYFTSITRKARGAFKHDLERADVSMCLHLGTVSRLVMHVSKLVFMQPYDTDFSVSLIAL